MIFWAVAAYGSETARCFEGSYFSHPQGRRTELAAYLCWCLPALLFDPEDEGDIFLRNIGLSPNYIPEHLVFTTTPVKSSNPANK
jgi:hypothetical protein